VHKPGYFLIHHFSTALEKSAMMWRENSVFNARSMDVYLTRFLKLLKEDSLLEIINTRYMDIH
jgi:hypothetical protein